MSPTLRLTSIQFSPPVRIANTSALLCDRSVPSPILAADIHINAGGAIEVAVGDFNANPSFPQSAINCETNAGTHVSSLRPPAYEGTLSG